MSWYEAECVLLLLFAVVVCSAGATVSDSAQEGAQPLQRGRHQRGLGSGRYNIPGVYHHTNRRDRNNRTTLLRYSIQKFSHSTTRVALRLADFSTAHPSPRPSHRNLRSDHKPKRCSSVSLNRNHPGNQTSQHLSEEVDSILCRYYGTWSKWRPCDRKCQQKRVRRCRAPEQCGRSQLTESRACVGRKKSQCSGRTSQSFRASADAGLLTLEGLIMKVYDVAYTPWSSWSACTRSCKQRRRRKCTVHQMCENSFIQESRQCGAPASQCQRRLKPRQPDKSLDRSVEMALSLPTWASTEESTQMTEEERIGKQKDRGNEAEEQATARQEARDILGLMQQTCGRRPAAGSGSYRVVGGQEAQRLSWPWQVAILTQTEEQYCAGTLIAPQWVLTAAHCVRKKNRRRRILIRVGEHNLEEFEGSEEDMKPDKEFPHTEFDYLTITNDIALVHLPRPTEERSQPAYACLPDADFAADEDSLCYILGWGKRRNVHLFGADVLHEVQVPLVSHKRCQKVFQYDINNKTQMCAGFKRGGKDACAGDSGGPLLCPQTVAGETRWFLTGITSYGEGCGKKGKFGIYTNVANYRQWIADTLQAN